MRKFEEYLELAEEKLGVGGHVTLMTYPSLQDPRLLLTALQNIFLAMDYAMNAVLEHEVLNDRIKPFKSNFPSRFSAFRMECAQRLGFNKKTVMDLWDIRNILLEHKNSPMEFVRKGKLVICSKQYEMKILSFEGVQGYLASTKDFVSTAFKVTGKSETLFRQSALAT